MAFEIFVAVRYPLFHRVHFTSTRTVRKIWIVVIIGAFLSTLHYFYGYNTALAYVPQLLAVVTNEHTTAGYVYVWLLMGITSISCTGVIVWSALTMYTLHRTFRAPRTSLSNGAIQRDPVSGATLITYSAGTAAASLAKVRIQQGTTHSIAINNASSPSIKRSKTSVKKARSKLSSRGTRQFSRRNLLTILFGLRFATLWFGSLIGSYLIVMFTRHEEETILNSDTTFNDTVLFATNSASTSCYESASTERTLRQRMRMIRLSVMFHCVCLIGIGDIFFYLICNKRFRKANYYFLRRIRVYLDFCFKFKYWCESCIIFQFY